MMYLLAAGVIMAILAFGFISTFMDVTAEAERLNEDYRRLHEAEDRLYDALRRER